MSNDPKEFELDADLDAELEALFAEARKNAPVPSEDFLARIEAQSLAEQPMQVEAGSFTPPAAEKRGWFDWHLGFAGWSSLGGLTAALVVGFGIGISPPDAVTSLTSDFLGSSTPNLEDVLWTFDSSLLEG